MNMNLGDTRLLIEVEQEHGLLRNQMAYVQAKLLSCRFSPISFVKTLRMTS